MDLKKKNIQNIKAPIASEMKQFDAYFKQSMKSKVRLLNIVNHYIVKRKGKEIRPIITLLSAKLFGKITSSSYIAATLTQLLHTATLVHDDVVDEAYERRGFFSIHALWGTKIAVLVGDYLLSKGLLVALENKEYEQLQMVSEAVKEMSEGELLQQEKSRKQSITESVYFDIIYKKTASLIAACTRLGALSAGASQAEQEQLKQFGIFLGIAFQLKDDLLDYEEKSKSGKANANDIKERKLTLPLIHVMENCTNQEKKWVLRIVRKANRNPQKVRELIQFVRNRGGMDYAQSKIMEYKEKAKATLCGIATSDAKTSLLDLLEYSTTRHQ